MSDTYHAEVDGVIDNVEVSISVEGDEALAEKILMDLESRAEEINQIVELDRHPAATDPSVRIDWEGWQRGEYDEVKR